jgi:hypothetical protein
MMAIAALCAALPSINSARASNPGTTAIPILDCADVNGNGAVEAGDIVKVVQKFGTTAASASYHPLYDVGAPVGSVAAPDIAAVVADFGDTNANGHCPVVDTEIAQATLWVIQDHPGLLTLNDALLVSLGYTRGSIDVPGQGVHYTNASNWDATFEPAAPEGLVYIDGNEGARLLAQLYYVDGDVVGWGPNPDPEHTNIDPFCEPVPADSACSWDGPGDSWHFHINLCTIHIGTPRASNTFTSTPEECEAMNGGDGGWAWRARVGWMGHLWNHIVYDSDSGPGVVMKAGNPNGRFADCFPDGGIWKPFNCPQ